MEDDGMTEGRPGSVERLIDAAANRAREGLRVAEDHARFVRGDAGLAGRLKSLRHEVTALVREVAPGGLLLAERDTPGDVGRPKEGSSGGASARGSSLDVVTAALKRAEESLRSLEEWAKLRSPSAARGFERLRYSLYEMEKRALSNLHGRESMAGVRLCVLVTRAIARVPLVEAASLALEGGADCIQLREKGLADRELAALARELVELCRGRGAAFIVNDRADVARAVGATGVHVGQDDLSVADARAVVGEHAVVGRSTHGVEQALVAEKSGATYLGVGPVYPTATKGYEEGLGLDLVREVARVISIPWFAIGGVTRERLDELLEAGARRVAVSSAVLQAHDIAAEAARLRERLDAAWRDGGD
jgi:thiamine-phosphate pyrophosphorylase